MRVKWEGFPEKYWPRTETPWRVTWGIGCFSDFATKLEAEAFRLTLIDEGVEMVDAEVFNAAKVRTGAAS